MYTGFTTLCTDTTTLLDATVCLSDLYSAAEREETFHKLMKNLPALMTDRAAVNKSFGHALDAERRQVLQTDDDIKLLYCNAHYLLGLSESCEQVC